MEKKLKTGCAYHGNRMLSHAIPDMKEIARAEMDIVVHMLSHTDWERHDRVMGDIFRVSEAEGLEVWVDNWGIGGAPGDRSHFLAYHPEAHTYYGNGIMHRYQVCLNAPAYRQFVKDWLDKVAELGGKTVMWDEPFIPAVELPDGTGYYSACTCPTCRKRFEERFARPMPEVMDEDVASFRRDLLIEFHEFVAGYARSLGIRNVACIEPHQLAGINSPKKSHPFLRIDIDRLCACEALDNIGTDPYWFSRSKEADDPYGYVYESTKTCVAVTERFGKDHNIWIQGYRAPRGREEEIYSATYAAYDAGARTILSWGFHGSESNTYRSELPERSWLCTVEAMRDVKRFERAKILEENRKRYQK